MPGSSTLIPSRISEIESLTNKPEEGEKNDTRDKQIIRMQKREMQMQFYSDRTSCKDYLLNMRFV